MTHASIPAAAQGQARHRRRPRPSQRRHRGREGPRRRSRSRVEVIASSSPFRRHPVVAVVCCPACRQDPRTCGDPQARRTLASPATSPPPIAIDLHERVRSSSPSPPPPRGLARRLARARLHLVRR
jgi:hypothetical protein